MGGEVIVNGLSESPYVIQEPLSRFHTLIRQFEELMLGTVQLYDVVVYERSDTMPVHDEPLFEE